MDTSFDPVVLVTGASRGIGKSITNKLLDSSIRVFGTYYNTSMPEPVSQSDQFQGIKADLSSLDDLRESILPLFQDEDSPNVIVNNAGISEEASFSLQDADWLKNWKRTLLINLQAPAMICKWALNRWSEEADVSGIIINISSRAAYRGDTGEFAAYAASKGGLAAFTKSIARSYGSREITAYTIAPGFVDTDMAAEVKQVYGNSYLTRDNSLDEITPPEQIAQLVHFLARGKGRHMTGTTFHINAGSYMV